MAVLAIDDDVDDFAPRPTNDRKTIDAVSHFPSHGVSEDGLLNLKGLQHAPARFKSMCGADCDAYWGAPEILMDKF